MNTWKFDDKCNHATWVPNTHLCLITVAIGNTIIIINPKLGDRVLSSNTDAKLVEYRKQLEEQKEENTDSPCKWHFYEEKKNDPLYQQGYRIRLTHQKEIKNFAWHTKGDYMASVLDVKNSNTSVIMHQLSKQKSVRPFAKMTGSVQQVAFHPFKPILFVAV